MSLTRQILLAMLAAVLLGSVANLLLADNPAPVMTLVLDDFLVNGLFLVVGKIFVASLKLLVVPLVLVSLICGICHLGDQSRLGWLTVKTVGLYLLTTAIAVALALLLANLIDPGAAIQLNSDADFSAPAAMSLTDVLVNIFPSNPFRAMVDANMLQVIIFAILLGVAISQAGAAGARISATFNDWNEVLLTMVSLVMKFAPWGVFSLLFSLFARQGLATIGDLFWYMLTIVLALLIHSTLVYGLILKLATGLSPRIFLRKMWHVQLFAFSTSSSSATLPVTLETVEKGLGVNKRVSSFAIPLGATINMDGTAIMQGVATVFIAQAFMMDLSLTDYLMVIMTAVLASIGTAGVPGVGLVTLAMVLQQVGLPVEGIALIIGVDRLLDMLRTAVNVTGDAMVAVVVANSEGALDRGRFLLHQ
jgi:Na+/H+-dicarboxylate symporter